MKKTLLTLSAALMLLSFVGIANAATVEKERGYITTEATETNLVDPDLLVLTVSIETQAKTAKEAMEQNSKKATSVVSSLKSKVNANEVSTSNITVYPVYNYKNRANSIDYYRAQNEITVKTTNINIGGELISAALNNGANKVVGLNFELKDRSKYCSAAMQKSIATAYSKAQIIAKSLGTQLDGVKKVYSNCTNNAYTYNGMRMLKASASMANGAEADSAAMDVPVEIKKIPVISTTTVEFYVK